MKNRGGGAKSLPKEDRVNTDLFCHVVTKEVKHENPQSRNITLLVAVLDNTTYLKKPLFQGFKNEL